MSRRSGARGLVVIGALLLILLAVGDLLRTDSFLLSTFRGLTPSTTPIERGLKQFQRDNGTPRR